MRDLRLHVVAARAAVLVVSGCGKEESAPGPATKAAVEEKVAPYTYPPGANGTTILTGLFGQDCAST